MNLEGGCGWVRERVWVKRSHSHSPTHPHPQIKIRQQIAMVNSITFGGSTSLTLRWVLFATFVVPLFTWLYDDLYYAYWTKYLQRLVKSLDGYLLLEQSCLNVNRSEWQEEKRSIQCLYRSKRFVTHVDVLGYILYWLLNHGSSDSIAIINVGDIRCFAEFPETF
jgi:hypothetical protein